MVCAKCKCWITEIIFGRPICKCVVEKLVEASFRVRCEYKESIYFRKRDYCEKNCVGLGDHSEVCKILGLSPCLEKYDEALATWDEYKQCRRDRMSK